MRQNCDSLLWMGKHTPKAEVACLGLARRGWGWDLDPRVRLQKLVLLITVVKNEHRF